MRKAFIILALSLASTHLHAQSPAGTFSLIPRVGATLSNITNESIMFSSDPNTDTNKGKTKLGMMAGIDLQYQFSAPLAISLGGFFQQSGCTYADTDLSGVTAGEYEVYQHNRTTLNYLAVPLMGHLYVAKDFSLNLGVQASFLLSNKMHSDISSVTIGKDGSYTYTGNGDMIDEESKYVNKFELSIPLGVSYEKEHVVIDARYLFGLSKVFTSPLGVNNRNRTFILSAGYKFDFK
ncbi:MAG: PorT family protein [Prevotella sp.]|nr:PorT family protein [Prevotella sp.]